MSSRNPNFIYSYRRGKSF